MNKPKPRTFVPEKEIKQEPCFAPNTTAEALERLTSDKRIELILGRGGDLEFLEAKTKGHPKAALIITSYHSIWLQCLRLPNERHGHASSRQNSARFCANVWLRQTVSNTHHRSKAA